MPPHNLGQFIRKHRERLQPEETGLRTTGRRRTPGLRREELAQLCAVSPTWITWLEQGRPVSASTEVLARLAEVLQLTAAERHYLFTLAGKLDLATEQSDASAADAIVASVAHITSPAYVLDRQWNARAWNPAAQQLFHGWLDTEEAGPRNLLRFTFLTPQARELIDNWSYRAKRLVAEFRADCGRSVDDAEMQPLITELCQNSTEFAAFWQDYEVTGREGGIRVFQHPQRGQLVYEQVTFYPATRRDLKLVMLLPAPADL
ncbi:helix-turn-helix transcriptional regulator [Pseudogulbenkiania subflava]|uniref:Helix-turn-helix domain-containing protein n=1 Tax=Pseudogulbenkiania subflava DSM 22618 TaxID=1123014 RepID=A0A1Y6BMW4_9NEIS|nr:helix-turn-helix transcriptional regulator [Pseudogulbenkiania subflava]SMF15995.1 Helix-turn-helix domain-containing protein [Pseudogulbenkiania subflava DSM 22618]